MVAKPLCPLYKYIIKPLDRAYYPELRYIRYAIYIVRCIVDMYIVLLFNVIELFALMIIFYWA